MENNICTCKKKFRECEYWKIIIKKYKKNLKLVEDDLYNLNSYESKKHRFLFYMFNKWSLLLTPEEINKYAIIIIAPFRRLERALT